MFQALSSLFFGSVDDVTPELKGPKPCVIEADEEGWLLVNLPEGATAEASPMEDLLIEHPSMSVYVSPGPLPAVEESATSLAGSISRMSESALPAVTRSSLPTRVTRGAAAQAGALAKVTQVSRVQRAKARTERRHLARNRMQRQNRVREQVQRRSTHTRNSFLHQPCQRNICH
ncbi:tumor protein p53-inducible nuclear protein 2 isoform X3 [Danio aesculapii]|uniref:tumor protein p53-inducible nuclear protein 2 isoform X3 n=1 Tax=Danio aesculapii TaxID=1142201 RepID=UPI0024BFE59B|nr:tumor protein p53-inducible nuclear protein 2 isoform X3 [Danio aesculapii]